MDKKDVMCVCVCMYIHTYIYIHRHTVEYYSSIKNENLPFVATRMDLEDMLSEINQRKKDA